MEHARNFQFVDDAAGLGDALQALQKSSELAFDLEFDSNYRRYGVTLCLIQIATPDHTFLIDPLAGLNLAGLWAVMEAPGAIKLVHSPGEDLRILHSLKCYPAYLWDTEIAARLLNYEQTSLSAMLEAKLGVELSGKQQRSNWFQRPLSEEQMVYAAADAEHLFRLKAVLDAELKERGLWDFAVSEQQFLSAQRYGDGTKTSFLKEAEQKFLSPWQIHIGNAVMGARDAIARDRNKPAFQIADDKKLKELYTTAPLSARAIIKEALALPFRSEKLVDQIDDAYYQALREAKEQGLSKLKPRRDRLPSSDKEAREKIFGPLQHALGKHYGQNAARFLLSNGTAGDLMDGKKTLRTMGSAYRRTVILKIAAELGSDISIYDGDRPNVA